MALEPDREDDYLPPSYAPSHPARRGRASDAFSLPPSFAPSQASGSKPLMGQGESRLRVHGEHPSSGRRPRVSAWSTHVPGNGSGSADRRYTSSRHAGDDRYPDTPYSYGSYPQDGYPDSGYPGSAYSDDGTRGYGYGTGYGDGSGYQNAGPSRSGGHRSSYPDTGGGGYPPNRHTGPWRGDARPPRMARPKRRHRFLRFLATLLVILIVLLAALLLWANSLPSRFTALTEKSNDSSETWLILGSDARDGTVGGTAKEVPGERTDTSMLLVKPHSGPSALISIPRDTLVTAGGRRMKLNSVAELEGWPQLTQSVETISGMKVDHVVKIGFSGVTGIVDALGGVDLCYDRTVNDARSGMNWTAGCHTVNGEQALAFSRMRYSDPEGDFGRAKRQRQVIQAAARKILTPQVLLNPATVIRLTRAGMTSLTVDNSTNTLALVRMALAFRSATGPGGITGLPYITNMGYSVPGVGSCVLLNTDRTLSLFDAIAAGTQQPGTVGGVV